MTGITYVLVVAVFIGLEALTSLELVSRGNRTVYTISLLIIILGMILGDLGDTLSERM